VRKPNSILSCALIALSLSACASFSPHTNSSVLIDGGKGLENFNRVGEANWQATETDVQANKSSTTYAYLVTKSPYRNFRLTMEFWASTDANSGVFFRCQDPQNITAENCYEANIFDQRPDPSYGTGGIVLIAKSPVPMPKAGGKWNTYEITADGPRLTLKLNGSTTVDIQDTKLAEGYLALQWGGGVIKFRRLEIKSL
jgi:Domain of Unknown Function (DUF1080)